MSKEIKWDIPLYLFIGLDTVLTLWGMWYVGQYNLGLIDFVGFVLSCGLASGLGILVSHEMMHKPHPIWRFLGAWQLSKCSYGHFFLEHLYGHHKNVSTPLDSATSTMGQTFYNYLPQTIFGSLRSSWNIEKRFLQKMGSSMISFNNKFVWFSSATLFLVFLSYRLSGMTGVVFYLGQAIVAILLLEDTNYLRHYGLARKEVSKGVYE
jgi:alkane 1-monooxygenase